MSALSVADVLERAADLIEPEGAWTQGYYGRNAHGQIVEYASQAVCFCALGAIAAVRGDRLDVPWSQAERQLDNALTGFGITSWNDADDRTQAEVVAKLREAAALARKGEA